MNFFLRKILKTTLFVLVFGLLFFFFNLFYNQEKESVAQEPTLTCEGEEIPLGEALDEALALAGIINDNLQTVFTSSQSQIEAAKTLFDLPEGCKAANCQTECRAVDNDGDGFIDDCSILPCSGNPCPPGAADLLTRIQGSYNQINNSKNAINDAAGRREDIINKLNEARRGLAKCVTPAGVKTEAEAEEVKNLLTCQEAKYQRGLPSGKADCDNPNNFLCCYYK